MALTQISKPNITHKQKGKVDPLSTGVSILGTIGSAYSGNYLGAAAGAASTYKSLNPQSQTYQTKDEGLETDSAMLRRSQYMDEDPMASLREAQAALAQSGLDPKMRQEIEAPILKALQTRRA